ncbi:MAG: 1-deoxy-D-xylulose-5-phosphate synthase [Nevskia sp.]|nr:1-deoxy-D-xylulose-5-phosphate synthase [Nevskia sp.]
MNGNPRETPGYALLGGIHSPADLRKLASDELPRLALEIRRYLIETLARAGGHFAANLGTVELTLALHYVLDTPHDRLIWDVGHQAYPHKLLTGRRAGLEGMRKLGGLAPFLSRDESEYDAFGAGHSSTSISAAAGMAAAAKLKGESRRVVAVIGDGGLTAGLAFEALNHIGALGLDVLVVCNDNDMSISENVGALREHAARTLARAGFDAPHAKRPPKIAQQSERELSAGALFESLGFRYHGPVDGHDSAALLGALQQLKDQPGPRFLHVVTVKGKGFEPAEAEPIRYHGVTAFDPVTGAIAAAKPGAPAYSKIFGDWLCAAAAQDARIVAITPAMREGSGLVEFSRRFPERYFDVGIAEQHAVTLAAGLACEGMRPVVAIYSTFLQRGYDQLIHDVAIQQLPVLFAIDRGGLVGADGATHHGAFDLSFLRCIPELVVMTPSDENECQRLLATALTIDGPTAVRYPRGAGTGVALDAAPQLVELGKARVVREARGRRQPRVAFLVFGTLLQRAVEAAEILDAGVADMRFVKPLDQALIRDFATNHDLLVTLEDNAVLGGAGSAVNEFLLQQELNVPVLNLGLPDRFVSHGSRDELLGTCGLDSAGILRAVQKRLRARNANQPASGRAV